MKINAINIYNNPYSNQSKCCGPRKNNNFMPARDNVSFGLVTPPATKNVRKLLNNDTLNKALRKTSLVYVEQDVDDKLYASIPFSYIKNKKAAKKIVKKIKKLYNLKKNWLDDLNDGLQRHKITALARIAEQFEKQKITPTTCNIQYKSKVSKPDYSWDWKSTL